MQVADLRREYTMAGLRRSELHSDPLKQVEAWFMQAVSNEVLEPNAMTLATVDAEGQPSSRIVLLKGIDQQGFAFYTNYLSRKGQELERNPRAAATLFWPQMERQICVRGAVEKLPRETSETYFKTRPLGSRLGAWVSIQSSVVASREELEKKLEAVSAKYGDHPPLPDYWGGYLLKPVTVEFWQGRPNRLHDRFRYSLRGANWRIDRLSP